MLKHLHSFKSQHPRLDRRQFEEVKHLLGHLGSSRFGRAQHFTLGHLKGSEELSGGGAVACDCTMSIEIDMLSSEDGGGCGGVSVLISSSFPSGLSSCVFNPNSSL